MGMIASREATTPFHFEWSPGLPGSPASLELVKPLHRLRDARHHVGGDDVEAELLRSFGAGEPVDVGRAAGGFEPSKSLRRQPGGHPGEDVTRPSNRHCGGVSCVEPHLLAVAHDVRWAFEEDDDVVLPGC